MSADADSTADPASASWLEDLVAEALEVLDREGEEGLEAFLAKHPGRRERVLELVTPFRNTGLLARDARDRLPERLGEFRLIERLGSGGMGVVFLAEQESLARVVALKVIRPDLVFFAGTRERFRREIDVVARLQHPAIVPIVATGEHDGMPWYAMQRIVGCTVDDAVKRLRGRNTAELSGADLEAAIRNRGEAPSQHDRSVFADGYWQACVRLMRQAALGLEHAHRQGVVHRDVKPSNVMLTADGRAMLLDFGLARVHGDPKLTRTGGEPGSPAYMAPEQIRGSTADERADVYSLAATLFQMLDLEPPFAAPDSEQLRQQILQGRLHGVRNRAVPHELRLVLSVAMDVDRERRYATAAEFAADLDNVLARQPIAAHPLPLRVRGVRWLQRHRAWSSVLLVAATLAVVLPAVLAWQQSRSLEQLRVAKKQVEDLVGQQSRSLEELRAAKQQVEELAGQQSHSLEELRVAKKHVEASRDRALAAISRFLTRFAARDLMSMPGGQGAGADMLADAVKLLDTMTDDVDPAVLKNHRTYARRWYSSSLYARGDVDAAKELALTTIADWAGPPGPSPGMALMLASTRLELQSMAARGVPVPDLEAVLAPLDAEIELAASEPKFASGAAALRAQAAMDRAARAVMRGDSASAEAGLAAAVAAAAAEKLLDDDTLATLRNRYGDVLRENGRLDESREQFLAARELLAPRGDPALGRPEALALRAHALWGLGRFEYLHERWGPAVELLVAAADQFEHHVYAYPDDVAGRVGLASVFTELAQVERKTGATDAAVTARLERAHRLFAGVAQVFASDARTRSCALVNLSVLSEQQWKANDAEGMAASARDLAAWATHDPERLSQAAWRFLQAAVLFDDRDAEDRAKACDAEALKALLACEAAGWFPPIDLGMAPVIRLRGNAEYDALCERHPREKVSRVKSK